MGVGGGLVAREPGGERIVSCWWRLPFLGSRCRSECKRRAAVIPFRNSRYSVGGRARAAPLVVFGRACQALSRGLGLTCGVRREASWLGAIHGKHDKKLPRSDLWITFRKTCFVLTAEPGAAFATRDALYIKPEAASNTILLTASAARAMRLIH